MNHMYVTISKYRSTLNILDPTTLADMPIGTTVCTCREKVDHEVYFITEYAKYQSIRR